MRSFGNRLLILFALTLAAMGCDVFLPGDVGQEGAPCLEENDCEPGFVCGVADHKCHDATVTGGQEDDPCTNDQDCIVELYCLHASEKPLGICAPDSDGVLFGPCYKGDTCQAPFPCWQEHTPPVCLDEPGKPGGKCKDTLPKCDTDNRCIILGQLSMCVPGDKAGEGQGCFHLGELLTICEPGLHCNPGNSTCVSDNTGGNIGDPCESNAECTVADSYCMINHNVCAGTDSGEMNQPCFDNPLTGDLDERWCAAGLLCNDQTVCVADDLAGTAGHTCRSETSDPCNEGLYCLPPKSVCVPVGQAGAGQNCYDLDGDMLCHVETSCNTNGTPPVCEHPYDGLGMDCKDLPEQVCGVIFPNCLHLPEGLAFCTNTCTGAVDCGMGSPCCKPFADLPEDPPGSYCLPETACFGQPCDAGTCPPGQWCLTEREICVPEDLGANDQPCFEDDDPATPPLCASGLVCGPDHICTPDPCRYLEVPGSGQLFSMAFGDENGPGITLPLRLLHGADSGAAGVCTIDPSQPLSDPDSDCHGLEDSVGDQVPDQAISSVAAAWDPDNGTVPLQLATAGIDEAYGKSQLATWQLVGGIWTVAQSIYGPIVVRANYKGNRFVVAEVFLNETTSQEELHLAWYDRDANQHGRYAIGTPVNNYQILDLSLLSSNQDQPWMAAGIRHLGNGADSQLLIWGTDETNTYETSKLVGRLCEAVLFLPERDVLAVAHRPFNPTQPDTGNQYLLELIAATQDMTSDPNDWQSLASIQLDSFIAKPTARVTNMVFDPSRNLLYLGVAGGPNDTAFTHVLRLAYLETDAKWVAFYLGSHPTHAWPGTYPVPPKPASQLALSPDFRWLASAGFDGYAFCDTDALLRSPLLTGTPCAVDADCAGSLCVNDTDGSGLQFCARSIPKDAECPVRQHIVIRDSTTYCVPDEIK